METVKSFLLQFNPADITFAIVILIFAIRGSVRGFIETLLNAAALLGGVGVGWLLYIPLSLQLAKIGIVKLGTLAAFLLIFITVYLLIKWIEHQLKRVTENKSISNLDKTLGFFAGALQGTILVVLFILLIVNVIDPFFNLSKFFNGSILFEMVAKLFKRMFEQGEVAIV